MKEKKERLGENNKILDFVKAKHEAEILKHKLSNIERKIEISELRYEKARKFLGQDDFLPFEKFWESQTNNIMQDIK